MVNSLVALSSMDGKLRQLQRPAPSKMNSTYLEADIRVQRAISSHIGPRLAHLSIAAGSSGLLLFADGRKKQGCLEVRHSISRGHGRRIRSKACMGPLHQAKPLRIHL